MVRFAWKLEQIKVAFWLSTMIKDTSHVSVQLSCTGIGMCSGNETSFWGFDKFLARPQESSACLEAIGGKSSKQKTFGIKEWLISQIYFLPINICNNFPST